MKPEPRLPFAVAMALLVTFARPQAIVRSYQRTPVPLTQVEVRGDEVVFAGSGIDGGNYAYRVYLAGRDGDVLKTMGGNLPEQRLLRDIWVSPDASLVYGVLEKAASDTLTLFKCDTVLGTVVAQRELTSAVGPVPTINGRSITVDSSGNVYVAGSFLDSNFKWAAYIAKYDGDLVLKSYATTEFNNGANVTFDRVYANPWGGLTTLGSRQTNVQWIGEMRTWTSNLAQTGTRSMPLAQTAGGFAMGAVDGNAVYMANTVLLPEQVLTARLTSAGGHESLMGRADFAALNCALGTDGFYVCGKSYVSGTTTPAFMKLSKSGTYQTLIDRDVPVPGYQGTAHAIAAKSGGCVLAGTVFDGTAFLSWQDSGGSAHYQDFVLGGPQQPNDIATNPFQNKAYVVTQTTADQSFKGQLTVFVDEPPLTPSTFEITKGKVVSGGLGSLAAQDGDDLVVQPDRTSVEAEFTATTPYSEQFAINVVLFGTAGIPAAVDICLWDWSTSTWVLAGTGQQGALFSQVIAPVGVAPDRFVEPGTRTIKGRVTYRFTRLAQGAPGASVEHMLAKMDMFKVYVTAP